MNLSEIYAKIEVVFEDHHLIILNKPARLPVAADESGDKSLLNWAREQQEQSNKLNNRKGYLVPLHFIDRPTSGLVMFAKSSKAAQRMNDAFKKRTIVKKYLAIVEIHKPAPPERTIVLEDFLSKNKSDNKVTLASSLDLGAKKAYLKAYWLAQKNNRALLEVLLGTGRSHQIRVQLSSRGWPIVGDLKYGAQFAFDHKIALHAFSLQFEHPVSKERLIFTKYPGKDWELLDFSVNYPLPT